jgi:hypothetical protein
MSGKNNPFFNPSRNYRSLEKVAQKNQIVTNNPVETWREDFDIVGFDKTVQKFLSQNRAPRMLSLNKQRVSLDEQLEKARGRVAKLSIEAQIASIDAKIERELQSLTIYQGKAAPFIELYQKMGTSIYGLPRIKVIEGYLRMAFDFYPHRIMREAAMPSETHCPKCLAPFQIFRESDDDNTEEQVTCPKCFVLYDVSLNTRIVPTKKKEYDSEGNFNRHIDQYEGKINIIIPKTLFSEFDRTLTEKNWKKENLQRKDIITLLRETGYSELYPHASRIGFEYCNIALPDLTTYRSDLLEDYEAFQKVFKIMEKDRESSLNGLVLLFKFLERRGLAETLEDFKDSISDTTLRTYQKIWKEACNRLEW